LKAISLLIGTSITILFTFNLINGLKSGSILKTTLTSGLDSEATVETATRNEEERILIPADLEIFFEEEYTQSADDTLLIPANLKYILEEKNEVDGYIIETYREYEIYIDENGSVIKQIPTSNFEYIKYKR
jgi:hypothetical protein